MTRLNRFPSGADASSFRDPAGYVFVFDNILYRQVNEKAEAEYRGFVDCGLYQCLVDKQWLIEHIEVQDPRGRTGSGCILQPRELPYISYPYEWSFQQLKDAALLTLSVQRMALQYGYSLKDASAFNVQFDGCSPIFIDTLSFERYQDGKPWVAYRQFCQHFLAPLAVAAHKEHRLRKLALAYIDGIPLDLASKLLPGKTWLHYSLLSHLHLHARAQAHYADHSADKSSKARKNVGILPKAHLLALLESLEAAVRKQHPASFDTEWKNYYDRTNYSSRAASHKAELLETFLGKVTGTIRLIQDLGSNNGHYSRVAAKYGAYVVSQDVDANAVDSNYRHLTQHGPKNILPLELDLTTPSPAVGWANSERMSFADRCGADVILALALIHHLAISNNLPLDEVAIFFAERCRWLIIEFVPKDDSQTERLMSARTDIFSEYNETGFESAFERSFRIHEKIAIEATHRTLYLMESRLERQANNN
ncbi:MAG: class I SAM-dependent methyltransferase [Gammaproteobacteria bacterium]|nr:class I SAM-dependent methyltransferase [Gammaproteobacteria bacterium]